MHVGNGAHLHQLQVAALALINTDYLWLLRQTIPHYPTDKKLEADRVGLEYCKRLGWDCRIWVQVLKDFQARNYTGDVFHPTDRRLQQAQNLCELSASKNPERMRQAPNAETFLH